MLMLLVLILREEFQREGRTKRIGASPRDFLAKLGLSFEIGVDVIESMDKVGFGIGLGML
jgi:hypothetical protein